MIFVWTVQNGSKTGKIQEIGSKEGSKTSIPA